MAQRVAAPPGNRLGGEHVVELDLVALEGQPGAGHVETPDAGGALADLLDAGVPVLRQVAAPAGELPGVVTSDGEFVDFEERWTGRLYFRERVQSFRTRHNCDLELRSATHIYAKPGRYTVAVKVIDIFGNDTMTLVPVTVG